MGWLEGRFEEQDASEGIRDGFRDESGTEGTSEEAGGGGQCNIRPAARGGICGAGQGGAERVAGRGDTGDSAGTGSLAGGLKEGEEVVLWLSFAY